VDRRHGPQQIGSQFRPCLRILPHQRSAAFRIAHLAENELDKTGAIGIAHQVLIDSNAVLEGRLPVEKLRGLSPPGALLGTIAVAHGLFLGGEPGEEDEPPVFRHATRAAEPADGAGPDLTQPAIHRRPQRRAISDLSLDHLYEHGTLSLHPRVCVRRWPARPRP
jgi:hypothetical protein